MNIYIYIYIHTYIHIDILMYVYSYMYVIFTEREGERERDYTREGICRSTFATANSCCPAVPRGTSVKHAKGLGHVHIHTDMCIVNMYVVYIYIYVCMYVCPYSIYNYIYIYTYIHTYIHTNIHTYYTVSVLRRVSASAACVTHQRYAHSSHNSRTPKKRTRVHRIHDD